MPRLRVLGARVLQVDLISRVLHPVFPLQTRSTAERDAPLAQHAVSADVDVLLDDDHRRAPIAGANRGGQARGAGADDDNVRRPVPFRDRRLRRHIGVLCAEPGHRSRADTGGGAVLEEFSPADGVRPLVAHGAVFLLSASSCEP